MSYVMEKTVVWMRKKSTVLMSLIVTIRIYAILEKVYGAMIQVEQENGTVSPL